MRFHLDEHIHNRDEQPHRILLKGFLHEFYELYELYEFYESDTL